MIEEKIEGKISTPKKSPTRTKKSVAKESKNPVRATQQIQINKIIDNTTNLLYNFDYSKVVVFYFESGHTMKINDYYTSGGKNLIKEYLSSLPSDELKEGYGIRHYIKQYGVLALNDLDTRQLRGKLYEIKFSSNRVMYVLKDAENIYFLHACKKQKGKAEKFEIEKAVRRAKEMDLKI